VFLSDEKPLEEKEFPDEADLCADDEEDIVPLSRCPVCGQLVYEETQQCPHCKEWIVGRRQVWRQSRKWYVRAGLYLTKTIVINWIFWLVMAAIVAFAALWELVR